MIDNKVTPPGPDVIAEEGFQQFKIKQKYAYKRLAKIYSLWNKFCIVLGVFCLIAYGVSLDNFYVFMCGANILTGLIANMMMMYARNFWHTFCHMTYDENTTVTEICSEKCLRKGDKIRYNGKSFVRLGCSADGLTPKFLFVESTDYRFIVEVTERKSPSFG